MTLYSTDFVGKVFYKLKDVWQMFYLTLSDKEITSPIQNLCELLEIIDNQSLSKKIIDFEDAWKQILIPESLLPQTYPIESILEIWKDYRKLEAKLATWVCCKNGKICSNSQDHLLECFKHEKERSP